MPDVMKNLLFESVGVYKYDRTETYPVKGLNIFLGCATAMPSSATAKLGTGISSGMWRGHPPPHWQCPCRNMSTFCWEGRLTYSMFTMQPQRSQTGLDSRPIMSTLTPSPAAFSYISLPLQTP